MVRALQCGLNRAEMPQPRAPTAKDKDSQTVPGGIHPRFEITIPKCLSWAPTRFILWSYLSLTSPRWHVNLSKHLLTTLFFCHVDIQDLCAMLSCLTLTYSDCRYDPEYSWGLPPLSW